MSEMLDKIKAENIDKASDEITNRIGYFMENFKKKGLQHESAEAFGAVVVDFASTVITAYMRNEM